MKAIIFDMDGVLIDSISQHTKAWHKALANNGLNESKEKLALLEGMNYKDSIEILSKKHNIKFTDKQKKKIVAEKNIEFEKIYKLKIYSVKQILKKTKKQNIKLAIVTGAHKEFAQKTINENFPNIFDFIITGDDTKKGKPSPQPYNAALKKLKIKPNEAIVIENAPLGIQSAKNAGIKVIALETTLSKKYLEDADIILKNHKELKEYLKKIN
ncbi:HAD family phosphatase [Candidatus Woesearchaeota archaeon]|nr:HAD family phosphatase [Candidatus Woesearchaeota archaeon]MCF7900679.1 HAD family phosphatase [Candidatus Woesearchaeota archaeon]